VCRPKHVEQLRNIGIINSTTRSHLVGSFCVIYITMQGSVNIMMINNHLETRIGLIHIDVYLLRHCILICVRLLDLVSRTLLLSIQYTRGL